MVAKNKSNKKQSMPPKSKQKGKTSKPKVYTNLDAAAKKWLAVLRDPCGAPMTGPCYAGTGEGYLTRTKDVVSIHPDAVDGVIEFSPTATVLDLARFGYSTTVSGSLGVATQYGVAAFLRNGTVGRFRPVAACVKVLYIGTELNRSGMVGLNLSAGQTFATGEAISLSAPALMVNCGLTSRLVDGVPMEVKWAPSTDDGRFISATGEEPDVVSYGGNSITIVYTGVPPGSLRLEFTAVWEWQPSEEVNTGLVSVARGPVTRNHMNEILLGLGDLATFAYGQAVSRAPQLAQLAITAF